MLQLIAFSKNLVRVMCTEGKGFSDNNLIWDSNDFCTETTDNLCLSITALLKTEYKHSIEALAALEEIFLAKNIQLQDEPPIF